MAGKKGVNVAIDYLNSFYPAVLIPDQLFKRAGCEGKLSSIEKGLRRARAIGRVKVEYLPNETGTDMIAHYQGVPGWKPLPKYPVNTKTIICETIVERKEKIPAGVKGKEKSADHFPPVYFFERVDNPGSYSAYYISIEALKQAVPDFCIVKLFTGSHKNPVRVSGGPNPK